MRVKINCFTTRLSYVRIREKSKKVRPRGIENYGYWICISKVFRLIYELSRV